jgi:hypothetical protein
LGSIRSWYCPILISQGLSESHRGRLILVMSQRFAFHHVLHVSDWSLAFGYALELTTCFSFKEHTTIFTTTRTLITIFRVNHYNERVICECKSSHTGASTPTIEQFIRPNSFLSCVFVYGHNSSFESYVWQCGMSIFKFNG